MVFKCNKCQETLDDDMLCCCNNNTCLDCCANVEIPESDLTYEDMVKICNKANEILRKVREG